MPKIYVPPSAKNEAMRIIAQITGASTAAIGTGAAIKISKDHHDKAVKSLSDKGHSPVVKEDHESAPSNHVHVSHTG